MPRYKRDKPRSINDALTDAFLVLKYEKSANPAVFGASVFGLHDIYKRLLPFVIAWRADEKKMARALPLHIATVDIRHCYDTIPHQLLCGHVLPLVLRHPSYVVSHDGWSLSRRGRHSVANTSGVDIHRDSMWTQCDGSTLRAGSPWGGAQRGGIWSTISAS
jgi:hypothetical protein